jgi:hypothetical protein
LSLQSDDLDSVGEIYTENDFRQLVVASETMPTFLGGLCELEDHGEFCRIIYTQFGRCRRVTPTSRRAAA